DADRGRRAGRPAVRVGAVPLSLSSRPDRHDVSTVGGGAGAAVSGDGHPPGRDRHLRHAADAAAGVLPLDAAARDRRSLQAEVRGERGAGTIAPQDPAAVVLPELPDDLSRPAEVSRQIAINPALSDADATSATPAPIAPHQSINQTARPRKFTPPAM